MSSVKSRAIRAGVKYVVTHPRSRLTRLVARIVVRRVTKKLASAPGLGAIPPVRGSRLTTLVGIVAVAGGIVLVVRRGKRAAAGPAAPPSASMPFRAAAPAAPVPETRDAPPTTPTTSPASEAAAAAGSGSDAATAPDALAAGGSGTGETPPPAAAGGADAGGPGLVARVEARIEGVAAPDVAVEENAGVITLRGAVADAEVERRLVRDTEQVEGVKAVQSELRTAADESGPAAS